MAPRLPVENGAAHHPHAESGGALSASAGAKAEQPPPSPAAKGIDGDGAALSALASGDEGATGGDVAAVLSRHSAADWLAMVLWMGWLHILLALLLLIALTFPHPLAIALLLLLATLAVTPVDVEGPLAQAYRRFIYAVVLRHFPVRMLFHDRTALTFGKPYVIAVEPHSVLPVGLGAFMCHALAAGGVAGATSAIFRVPLLRQCWQWARLAPATRALLSGVLQRGRPVIIVPGGVQECLFMAPGKEVRRSGVGGDGVWGREVRDGVWRDGVWRDGVWRGGVWRDGVWRDGVWRDGVSGGTFLSSDSLPPCPHAPLLSLLFHLPHPFTPNPLPPPPPPLSPAPRPFLPPPQVVFIRQRFGFIRLALQHGVPLLPCFVFGQTSAYRWWRPEGAWYRWVARRLGFAPILFWGMWGSPIPFRTPLIIVIGTPIGQGDPDPNPSKERVAAVHAEYVSALERLFLDYRAEAGYPTTPLEIL
ncbi:unnamed protein product [Closterium sp. NIES-54]